MELARRFIIDTSGGISRDPSMTTLSTGGFVVVYEQNSDPEGNDDRDIHVTFFDGQGIATSTSIPVSAPNGVDDYNPLVAALADGKLIVVWNVESTIFGQFLDDTGNPIGGQFVVQDNAVVYDFNDVTALANGGFVLTSYDVDAGYSQSQHFDANGNAVLDPNQYPQVRHITGLSDGGYVVSWLWQELEYSDITYELRTQQFTADGTLVRENLIDSGTWDIDAYTDRTYAITSLSDGGYAIVWKGQSDLHVSVFDANGNLSSTASNFASIAYSYYPFTASVVGLADGGFVVGWKDNDANFVSLQCFDAAANMIGDEIRIANNLDFSFEVVLTALDDNGFVVTWEQRGSGNQFVMGYTFPGDGSDAVETIFSREDDVVDFTNLSVSQIEQLATLADLFANDLAYRATEGNDLVHLADDGAVLAGNFVWDSSIVFEAGIGDDAIFGGDSPDRIDGGEGVDIINGGGSYDRLWGGAGDDRLYGDLGNDALHGGDGNDRLSGGTGNDYLYGDRGEDIIGGGDGNDMLSGGFGADTLYGNAGDDTISGGSNNDFIGGNDGNDVLNGDLGADNVRGGNGNDTLIGDDGDDRLYGDGGADTILGGSGIDYILGGSGSDNVNAGFGDDFIRGQDGNDTLAGALGNDDIGGGNGDDRIRGGLGNDVLAGNGGSDTFVLDEALGASNVDTILDMIVGEDTIELDLDIFTAIAGGGTLSADQFRAGTSATTADHRIIFTRSTGELFYDADGSGGGAQVKIAQLDAGLALSASDFTLAGAQEPIAVKLPIIEAIPEMLHADTYVL